MDSIVVSTLDIYDDFEKLPPDFQHELAFLESRHINELLTTTTQTSDGPWRLKERMKTVSVALVLCLNVGVDPPDIIKTQPCAKLECWFDPFSVNSQKAIDHIGLQLEKQYERWQSKARYKKCLDPTVEEIKKLCTSLRRNAKTDRILFHYNGHGVPKPTQNGEIWVFNKNYTQYIPLSIADLHAWMGSPSIYVFDCSCAGAALNAFQEIARQKRKELEAEIKINNGYIQRQQQLEEEQKNQLQRERQQQQQYKKQDHHSKRSSFRDENRCKLDTAQPAILDDSSAYDDESSDTITRLTNTATTTTTNATNATSRTSNGNHANNQTGNNHPQNINQPYNNNNNNHLQATNNRYMPKNNNNNNINIIGTEIDNLILNRDSSIQSYPNNNNIKTNNICLDSDNSIQLAACAADQVLPMNPDLPADLFTSCLTTPLKIALRWFIQQNNDKLLNKVSLDLIDKIPGTFADRKTMLGELNWIFTAVTDTIAWDVLPVDLFQRLFRQDLLVASLFRNFLLAERIMRIYNCTPISRPKLPQTHHHPMWRAWDMVVDLCLCQLNDVLAERTAFKTSNFFAEQLTAFEVWLSLDHSSDQRHPEQLPIVLQVLLSPVHRLRALDLLGRFLDLGSWAVNSALSVGIFPYVLKLLQSKAREIQPFLVTIWAKILANDKSCQVDLVQEGYHTYFLNILADYTYDAHYRTLAAFVMSCIVRDYPAGQEAAFQGSLIASCLEEINDSDANLRKWATICLGSLWNNYEDARWCGVRDSAHEKLYTLLDDKEPEVRAAAVYALGTFINSSNCSERTDHANTIDQSIGIKLVSTCLHDSSVLVRTELVTALKYLISAFEFQFVQLECPPIPSLELSRREESSKIVSNIWRAVHTLASDPHRKVSAAAQAIVDEIRANQNNSSRHGVGGSGSGSGSGSGNLSSSATSWSQLKESKSCSSLSERSTSSLNASFSSNNNNNSNNISNGYNLGSSGHCELMVGCPASSSHRDYQLSEWKVFKNLAYRNVCLKELQVANPAEFTSTGHSLGSLKCPHPANLILFHPYESLAIVSSKEEFSILNVESSPQMSSAASNLTCSSSNTNNLSSSSSVSSHHLASAQSSPVLSAAFGVAQHHLSNGLSSTNNLVANGKNYLSGSSASSRFLGTINNSNKTSCFKSRANSSPITSLQLVNPHDQSLVLVGSADGAVKIWKAFTTRSPNTVQFNQKLISAFVLLPELRPNSSHLSNGISSLSSSSPASASAAAAAAACNQRNNSRFHHHSLQYQHHQYHPYQFQSPGQSQALTSSQLLGSSSSNHQTSNLLSLHWHQQSSRLFASSDANEVRVIRVWDAKSESKLCDIQTQSEFGVTCLSSDNEHMIAAGFADGPIRIYDTRLKTSDCRTFTFRKHDDRVSSIKLFKLNEKHINLISGDSLGEVRFWDIRAPSHVKKIKLGAPMTAMAVHENADLFAW